MKFKKESETSIIAKLNTLRKSITLSKSEMQSVRNTKGKQIEELEELDRLEEL